MKEIRITLEKDERSSTGYAILYPYKMNEFELKSRQSSDCFGEVIEMTDDYTLFELIPDRIKDE